MKKGAEIIRMITNLLIVIVLSCLSTYFVRAQPGPFVITIAFSIDDTHYQEIEDAYKYKLQSHYSNQLWQKNYADYTLYFNGKQLKSEQNVPLYFVGDDVFRRMLQFHVKGQSVDGGRDFDSIAVEVLLDGQTHEASGKVWRSSFIQDFSGEYQNAIVPDTGWSGEPTRWYSTKPSEKELAKIIERLQKNRINENGDSRLFVLNSKGNYINGAFVIFNGDTLKMTTSGDYSLRKSWSEKSHIEVYHPDYPSLVLDSAFSLDQLNRVYLLKEGEPYYSYGGIRRPLTCGFRELAFYLDYPNGDTEKRTKMIDTLLKFWQNTMLVAKDYRKILDEKKDEFLYGGIDQLLDHIVHFKRNGNGMFHYKWYKKTVDYISNNVTSLAWARIPISFNQYLTAELRVWYKPFTQDSLIHHIEQEYNLENRTELLELPRGTKITYQLDYLYVPNHLVEMLMQEPEILTCYPKIFAYEIAG